MQFAFLSAIIYPSKERLVSKMIIDVKELDYLGFHLKYVEDKGWKVILTNAEIMFPHLTAAKAAIDKFYRDVFEEDGEKLPIPEEEKLPIPEEEIKN